MFKLTNRYIKNTLFTTAAFTSVYLTDRYNERVLSRNFKTLWAGLVITLDYKINFNSDNAQGIDALHERVATRILNLCKENAGLYIKIGQQIASINHVLPPKWNQIFRVLYDDAPSVSYDTYLPLFLDEFGKTPEQIFQTFDRTPMASASIAQVHKATLKTGETVAVKIQKPAIAKQIDWDLGCYRLVCFLFEKAFSLPIYWTVDNIEEHLRTEIDFVNEGRNAEKAYEFIQETDFRNNVHIPKVYWEFSSKRILTCEWIDGVKFDSKDALETAGFNVSQLMTTMVKVFADQLFRCGFVHCDPHPGNMIIRKHPTQNTYQIVLLDHGLYTISRPSFTTEYATFWKSLFTLDLNTLNKIATSWGISDTQSFASATLQRPWKMTSTPLHLQTLKYTVQDIYEMQINAKDKVSDFLKNTDKLPKELIFIGRNLNLIRSNNKAMGSPVNRINIMANYAATTLLLPLSAYAYLPFYKRIPIYFVSYCEYSIFKSTLFLSSITFYGNQVFQEIKSWMTGQKAKGHEDMLDQVAMMSMRKFGLQVDESTFDA